MIWKRNSLERMYAVEQSHWSDTVFKSPPAWGIRWILPSSFLKCYGVPAHTLGYAAQHGWSSECTQTQAHFGREVHLMRGATVGNRWWIVLPWSRLKEWRAPKGAGLGGFDMQSLWLHSFSRLGEAWAFAEINSFRTTERIRDIPKRIPQRINGIDAAPRNIGSFTRHPLKKLRDTKQAAASIPPSLFLLSRARHWPS